MSNTITMAYVDGSRESEQLDGRWWEITGEYEDAGEHDSLESAQAAAVGMGDGVYLVDESDGGHYDGAICVKDGVADYRPLGMAD